MSIKRVCFVLPAVLAIISQGTESSAGIIVYSNTTNSTGQATSFNGATQVGNNLAANVDLDQLTLAPGSGGMAINSISVLAYDFNSVSVIARPTIYIWAADGPGGTPGTFLADYVLPNTSFASFSGTLLSVTIPGTQLIVPSNGQIWAGLGYDNDNGAISISAADLNPLGALNFHPATVGIDGPQPYFLSPTSPIAVSNPSIILNGDYNFGWVIQASAVLVPEPDSLTLVLIGLSFSFLSIRICRSNRPSS